jgi:hypothetical protein
MMPVTHFLWSVAIAAALYHRYSYDVIGVIIGGVLIDIDHYLWYVWDRKDWNIFRAWRHFRVEYLWLGLEKNIKSEIYIFHNIEFLAVLAAASFYSNFIFMFTIGVVVHYALDLIYEYIHLEKGIGKSRSIIAWLVRIRRGKK